MPDPKQPAQAAATPAPEAASAAPGDAAGPEPTAEEMQHMALAEASVRHPFGPAFFMTQLRGFAGETWPDPAVERPIVEIHLGDGDTLELGHIVGVTPAWVALAVRDGDENDDPPRLRTEFVPFEAIARVTLLGARPESPRLGFEHGRVPKVLSPAPRPVMTPEAAIRAASAGSGQEPSGD